MPVKVVMPQLGESIAEGTILKWLKKEGDRVEKDEPLLEVSTDKIDSEIPSPTSGILSKIIVPEGGVVQVGKEMALIEPSGEQVTARPPSLEPTPPQAGVPQPEKPLEEKLTEFKPEIKEKESKRYYSPVVRSIAQKEGISLEELEQIQGSGLGGRVTKDDLLKYIEARAQKKKVEEVIPSPVEPAVQASERPPISPTPRVTLEKGDILIPITPMRKAIAEHMVRSVHTSPHVTAVVEVDMTSIVKFREKIKEQFLQKEGVNLTYLPFIIKATVGALKAYPRVNASWSDEGIILHKDIHIGIAVALEDGLVVPVIKAADEKSILGLAREVEDLARRAREGKLTPSDVEKGTFSITNTGMYGTLFATPIIHQPQAAILGVGAIVKRPIVLENEAIVIRSMMYLSFSFDHRIIDGAIAAQFLDKVKQNLETMDLTTLELL